MLKSIASEKKIIEGAMIRIQVRGMILILVQRHHRKFEQASRPAPFHSCCE
jgi:hypothetical protein